MSIVVSTVWRFVFGDHMGFSDHWEDYWLQCVFLTMSLGFPLLSILGRAICSGFVVFREGNSSLLSLWLLPIICPQNYQEATKITTQGPNVTVHIQAAAVLAETPVSPSDPRRFPCLVGLT